MKKNFWRGLLPLWLSAVLLAAWCNALAQPSPADFVPSRYVQVSVVFLLPLGIFFFCYALLRFTNMLLPWRIPWKVPRIILAVLSGLVILLYIYLGLRNVLQPDVTLPFPQFLEQFKPFQLAWLNTKFRTLPGLGGIFFCALAWELAFPLKSSEE